MYFSLRKGLSVNDIPGCSPTTAPCKTRTSFLRGLGLRKHRDEVTMKLTEADDSRPGGRNKIKSLRKTLTNMFHFKPRDQELGDKRSSSSTSLFKIPTKRNKSVPPGKRALPPVPAARTESRTPSPQSDLLLRMEGEQGAPPPLEPRPQETPEEDSQMDFALSIEKVKDVSRDLY